MELKTVLITGGSSGIGKAIGSYLTAIGHTVYGTTRSLSNYPHFSEFQLLEMDVREPNSIQMAVSKLVKKEGRLDVLINNAGVGITGPLEETPNHEVLSAFDTNFNGPLNVIKVVLPQMRAQNSGLIINITSIAGYMGLPYRGIYSATKGALAILTESLRLETRDFGIKVTAIAPGDFATNIASGRYHAPVKTDSPYEVAYQKTLTTIDNQVDGGGDPTEVAKLVHKIMQIKNPKAHYKVGPFLQKFSVLLKRMLPDSWYESLLLNYSK
ncbi:SDR family oxidoreductase [Maribacter chungangensis]|uniref:SDR family oxidoreductase n=1 Tax=Maribacter chungangensis TaxID=1069117 RepID=A0ABW3B2I9_9FLAO